jgi:hypothetical protein
VAGYTHEEDAVLDFRIEYHGGRGSPSVPEEAEAPPTPEPIGRCYVLPAQIRFLPSLQVSVTCNFAVGILRGTQTGEAHLMPVNQASISCMTGNTQTSGPFGDSMSATTRPKW